MAIRDAEEAETKFRNIVRRKAAVAVEEEVEDQLNANEVCDKAKASAKRSAQIHLDRTVDLAGYYSGSWAQSRKTQAVPSSRRRPGGAAFRQRSPSSGTFKAANAKRIVPVKSTPGRTSVAEDITYIKNA